MRFGRSVELRVEDNYLSIAPISEARADWDEAFQGMAAVHDDSPLLLELIENQFDQDEWTW